MPETQRSCYELTAELFPEYVRVESRVVALMEEVFELAFLEGFSTGRILQLLQTVSRKCTEQKEAGTQEEFQGEAGDIFFCLLTYAETRGFDLQKAMEEKVAAVRAKPVGYYAEKVKAKIAAGLVLREDVGVDYGI
jgi:NTP pyrophosphatase (non-canonical NTP hydrolase)